MRWVILAIAFFLFLAESASGQISRGGRPLDVPALKSRGIPEMVMPAVMNKELKLHYDEQQESSPRLKPFQFAHSFDVKILPDNDGLWNRNVNGYEVWRIKIKSAGAYSLNLIFDDFFLPDGARLFLYNEDKTYVLGAYTSANNKKGGKFAVSPVPGDVLTVQYEVPSGKIGQGGFMITQVNHDYIDILKYSERRPLDRTAGSCNVDVNCDMGDRWENVSDAVCRIIVDGREICTGTLMNNTAENERPFILSAAHCYDRPEYAETSVYTFNYESPFCAPLDGDPVNSISGAVMKASADSLDFSLVELSSIPPPVFRPYFSGWDRSGELPDSSLCIHHPQGDIKKIAMDYNSPVISGFSSDYTASGFLKVLRWEEGVTENGSSGGALFESSGKVIGTLTGGSASCINPVNDYFARFDLAWEYSPDSSKQLKYWLDPLNSNKLMFAGKRYYSGEESCITVTHLNDSDVHRNILLVEGNQQAGYRGGTNNQNITEFAERFSIPGDEQLHGISFGVGLLEMPELLSTSEITVKIYDDSVLPGTLIHSQKVRLNTLVADAMNHISFDRIIEPADTFFVGFELSDVQPEEKFVIYQALRSTGTENLFWFKQNNMWHDFQEVNNEGYSIFNVVELIACNVNGPSPRIPLVNKPNDAVIYPNPAYDVFTFEAGQPIIPENIRVFNLIGKEVLFRVFDHQGNLVQIDLSGNIPGIYLINFNSASGNIARKVFYFPR